MIEKNYPPKLVSWLASGGENFEVVLASEAVYVRNLDDRAFPIRLKEDDLKITRQQLVEAIGDIVDGYDFWETDVLGPEDRSYLVERLSAPRELVDSYLGSGLFLSPEEDVWVCLNAIDHLMFRVAVAGNDLETSYRKAREMEECFEENLPFAYSERFGFLTSKPTECGTGAVLRFLVHIPGIIFSNGFSNFRDKLLKSGSLLRPMMDESISTEGHLFVVHTGHSLGVDEEELLESALDTIGEITEMEFDARDMLLSKARFQIEDRILRGIGVLTHARMISRKEGYALANALRLGASENLLGEYIDLISATELFFVGQPEHLTRISGKGNEIFQDTQRVELFRSYLKPED